MPRYKNAKQTHRSPEEFKANAALLRQIERIHTDSREPYGSRRAHAALRRKVPGWAARGWSG